MNDALNNLNIFIDHSILHSDATEAEVRKTCEEARNWRFHSVVVNPIWVPLVRYDLRHSTVKVVTVCGFPLGANRTDIKVAEAMKAVSDGAQEIDMVANIGWLQAGDYSAAGEEIAEIKRRIPFNIMLKVIIECGLLSEEKQVEATKMVIDSGAQFIKTSTGFFGGVTVEQVQRIAKVVNRQIEIKAAGGIRTAELCGHLLEAGAQRLGCSTSVEIMRSLGLKQSSQN
ncbi:MAG TPA: deoxyribose-phosphate aldolase [candidate division Zixibacteria bacterium]|nr:deoxyribose-phosphate aldolase [candidate division Zixibacteria bacterium]